ncbi:MAG: FtsX-like permease family protein [Burkholderiaceae bacterium]
MAWTSRRRPAPNSRGAGSGLANTFGRWRSGLAIVQLTLCAVMLISSGALIKRLDSALRTDHAERVGNVVVARMERLAWSQPLVVALQEKFGAVSIELMHVLPGGLAATVPYRISRRDDEEPVELGMNIIGGEHLELAGLVLMSGRSFDEMDSPKSRAVALINESAVPRFRGSAKLGTVLFDPRDRPIEIIGVVRDAPFRTFQPRARPMIYFPYRQTYPRTLSLLIRPEGRLESASVESVVTGLASSQGSHVVAVTSLDHHLRLTSMAADRLVIGVVQVFAGLAVLLSMIGVSGVTSDAVARRAPEIALRIALGAPRWRIIGAVVMYGTRLAAAGASAAILLCVGVLPFVEPLTDGSRGPEFVIWITAPSLLLLMTIVSTVAPARRAIAIDPSILLRD